MFSHGFVKSNCEPACSYNEEASVDDCLAHTLVSATYSVVCMPDMASDKVIPILKLKKKKKGNL